METTTKTKRKVSLGIKIAAILTCVALLSVGFASWLIIKPAENIVANGTFTAYTVTENNVAFKADLPTTDAVIFGKTAITGTNNGWLVAGNDVEDQDLTSTATITASSKQGDNAGIPLEQAIPNIYIKFAPSANLKTAFDAAVSENLIALTMSATVKVNDEAVTTVTPSVTDYSTTAGYGYITILTAGLADDVTTCSIEVTFTFNWGSVFGSQNPYVYYNARTYTNDLATEASTKLGKIAALNYVATSGSDTPYVITVTAQSPASAS